MTKVGGVEEIDGVLVYNYELLGSDSLKVEKEKESRLVDVTKSLLVDEWEGRVTSIQSGKYNVSLNDIDGAFDRTFYIDLIEGSVNVYRKDERFVRKAVEFAKNYKRKGLGKFFVVRKYRSV